MKTTFIINTHHSWPFSEGRLNRSLVDRAAVNLEDKGYSVRVTTIHDGCDVEAEVEKHVWADALILQSPCNWMGVPWPFKKYMDEVNTAGMDGRLCTGEGRSRQDASQQYGSCGTLTGKKYMLSITCNALRKAFYDPEQHFFEGRSVDDKFWPMHLNFKFFGMMPLGTFACQDVLKNPEFENDFQRLEVHLDRLVPELY